jgi:hypothetical protein
LFEKRAQEFAESNLSRKLRDELGNISPSVVSLLRRNESRDGTIKPIQSADGKASSVLIRKLNG